MKTKNLLRAIAAVSLLTFSCAKDIETEVTPIEQTNGVKTYTMTVVAGKGEVGTKALNLTDGTLNATWAEGDQVTVYNKTKSESLEGYLEAQGSGASTTFIGTLTGTIEANDELTLKFLDSNYATQDGTLEYIATNCDYATAEVTVKSVKDGNITTTAAANFTNQQAIVEFTLKESDGAAISGGGVTSLIVTAGGTEITVTPTAATNVLYVAIPAISEGAISLQAVDRNGVPRSYEKTAATFENGQFYKIGVKMACIVMNDTQLFAAIEGSKVPEITLGADINLTRNEGYKPRDLEINDATTINLDNHFIAGYWSDALGRPADNIFYNYATLTINGPGTLKNGHFGLGGAIMNYSGTVTLNDVTITGCEASKGGAIYNNKASCTVNLNNVTFSGNRAEDTTSDPKTSAGGAIYNDNGTVNMNNVTFTGNSSKDIGGAIYNNGTLNIKGLIVASDNTAGDDVDNVYLASGKVITLNGALTEGTSIGVTLAAKSEEGVIFTSDYSTSNPSTDPNTFFSSDDAKQQISLKDDEIYLYNLNPDWYALNVPYLNQWEGPEVQTPEYIDVCAKLSSIQPQDIGDGNKIYLLQEYSEWYIVDRDELIINERIEVLGEVNIILADNTSLIAMNGIFVGEAKVNNIPCTLHIWAQSTGSSMGILSATSTENYAAIGGKSDRPDLGHDAGYLHFHGGEVHAVNQYTDNAPGIYGAREIGAGKYGTYIYGGKILATGGEGAAGIGTPFKGECGGILITGGYVHAVGGKYAAGIGSGHCGTMHYRKETYSAIPASDDQTEIRITGGEIIAEGNGGGAGIGGGQGTDIYEGDGPRFVMSGGKVDAQTHSGSAGRHEALAIGYGACPQNTYTPPMEITGNPSISATTDVLATPTSVTDWPSNIYYVHVIIEY